ncbi:MAG: ABC transporter permease subunit [Pseudomonadota bacterium]|nr:ABC transporter permease subunit [Pseudomonadota bacterium]
MAEALAAQTTTGASGNPPPPGHPLIRRVMVATAVIFLTLFIVIPVVNVFAQALSKGVDAYVRVLHVTSPPEGAQLSPAERRKLAAERGQAEKTWSSIRLTAAIAVIVVPLNIVFGLAAAWSVTKSRFKGRSFLIALIDLPFSVSPVIAGLIFVLLLGRGGVLGGWASSWTWPDPFSLHWRGFAQDWWPLAFTRTFTGIIFTPLAIVLASIFVTFPFVARALIPLMEAQGSDDEVAALSLGASGWRTFRKVTLPNVKWALLYGVILCTARVFGEFGAVSVVSGHIDSNDTMPLRIEKLWNEYNNQAAFSVASLLAMLAIVTLIVQTIVERQTGKRETRQVEEEGTP